jgi:hypothetical protein
MSEEIDRHVLRRFEICQKLGKGVSELPCLHPLACLSSLYKIKLTAARLHMYINAQLAQLASHLTVKPF